MSLTNQSIPAGYVRLVPAESSSPSTGLLLVLPDSQFPATEVDFISPSTGAPVAVYFAPFQGLPRDELMFVSDTPTSGLNVIGVQNLNENGYSAYIGRGSDGVEHFALGWGNPSSGLPEVVYLETSHFTGATHTDPPPRFQMQQTGYINGAYRSLIVFDFGGEPEFDGDYYMNFRQLDGNIGMRWCRDTGSLGIGVNSVGPVTRLDVLGDVTFGDSNLNRDADAVAALNIIDAGAAVMRIVKTSIGRLDFQMNGTGATFSYDLVDAFGNTPMSVNIGSGGRGAVEMRRISSATLQASSSYANDAAAAAGGVAVGEFYRNGSVVQCRIV